MSRAVDRRLLLGFTRSTQADKGSIELPEGDTDYQLCGRGQTRPDLVAFRWSEGFREQLAALREHTEAGVGEAAARVGRKLADLVDAPAWAGAAAQVAAEASEHPTFLTVRSSASELYLLPWELLTVGGVAHAGSLAKLLIRYEWPDYRTAPRASGLSRTKRGRVVFAWSAAGGKVQASAHVALIERGIDASRGSFDDADDRAFDEVKSASCESLRAVLERAKTSGEPVAVLHLLCHGSEKDGTFGLVLNDLDDPSAQDVVTPNRLQMLLAPYAGLVRLVVISACDAGNAGAVGQHLGSVAQEVHKAGFGAVIASRFPLSWDGARVFAAALYEGILGGLSSLEDAFLEARARLSRRPSYDWASLQLYAREADGDATFVFHARPYRGLAAYGPEHARFFFGRDREIADFVADLDGLVARALPRFIVVSGASGTGKSSMVLGGAIPRWKRASADGGFAHLVVRPGAAPAAALAQVKERLAIVGEVCRRFLVVVDQFEEVFTHQDAAGAATLARALWAMAAEPDSPVCVLVTMRVDFLARCNELIVDDAGLRFDKVACDPDHQVLVAQMSPEQLREAVDAPARAAGLTLEPGLAEDIVRDVEAAPGALPLMSHALYLLWRGRDGDVLTRAAYKALGAVQGALDAHAEQQLTALDQEADRAALRRLMVALVHPGSAGAPDTRRRRAVDELRGMFAAEPGRFDGVLAKLVDARLLVTSGGDGAQTVEVAHEALLRSWKTFKAWIDADRTKLAQLAQVDVWAAEWRLRPDALLRDSRLGYAEEVDKSYAGELGDDARGLLAASRAERDRARHAAAHARRVRRGRRAAAFLVMTGLAVSGVVLWRRAEAARAHAVTQERAALTSELRSRASELRTRAETTDLELESLADALTLRWEAARLGAPPAEVDGVMLQAMMAALTRPTVEGALEAGDAVVFSPDGARFAAAHGAVVSLWDARDGRLVATLRGQRQGPVERGGLSFSRDGTMLLAGFSNGSARAWGARDGRPEVVLGEGPGVNDGAPSLFIFTNGHNTFSSDGTLAEMGGVVRLTRDGRTVATLPAGTPPALDLHLLPDERLLHLGGDCVLRTWDPRREAFVAAPPIPLARRRCSLTAATIAPDGSRAIVQQARGAPLRVWNVRDEAFEAELGDALPAGVGVPNGWRPARFSPGARYVLLNSIADGSRRAAAWETARWRAVRSGLDGVPTFSVDDARMMAIAEGAHAARVYALDGGGEVEFRVGPATIEGGAFSPEGVTLLVRPPGRSVHVVGTGDNAVVRTLREHLTGTGAPVAFRSDSPPVVTALSANGARALVLHEDNTARVWNLAGGALVSTLGRWRPAGIGGSSTPAARARQRDGAGLSASGARALTTGLAGDPENADELDPYEVRLWDAASGRLERTLRAPERRGVAAAWLSPDGARVFTGHMDFSARLWDASTGAVVADVPAAEGETLALVFSRDGARAVTASARGALVAWDLRAGTRARTAQLGAASFTGATFSPDGARVLTASADHVDRLWDATSGRLLGTLPHAAGASRHAAFTADHARLATAYEDGSFALWNAVDGRLLAVVPAHLNAITDLTFSPDGARLTTESFDGPARLWALDPVVLTRAACALLRQRPIWHERPRLRAACAERR